MSPSSFWAMDAAIAVAGAAIILLLRNFLNRGLAPATHSVGNDAAVLGGRNND
jgi:hypothetical protein